jgi:L-arabinokinase
MDYEDLVAAVDVVVSKPGYGIVSECIANGTPLLFTSRGRFAEYDVMVEQMPRMLRCRHIAQEDLLAGRWRDDLEALLAQADPPERPRVDGAAIAASIIFDRM